MDEFRIIARFYRLVCPRFCPFLRPLLAPRVWFLSTLLILASAGPIWAESSSEHDRARSQWLMGYRALERADKLADRHQPEEALTQYQEARRLLKQVQATFPKWNAAMIQFRITYCSKRIKRLESSVKKQPKASADPAKVNARLRRKLKQYKAKLQQRDMEVMKLNQALDKARAEAARSGDSERNTQELVVANQRLKQEVATLEVQIEQMSREVNRLNAESGIQGELKALRKERNLLRDKRNEIADLAKKQTLEIANLKEQMRRVSLERQQAANKVDEQAALLVLKQERMAALSETLDSVNKDNEALRAKQGNELSVAKSQATKIVALERQVAERDQQIATHSKALADAELARRKLAASLELAEDKIKGDAVKALQLRQQLKALESQTEGMVAVDGDAGDGSALLKAEKSIRDLKRQLQAASAERYGSETELKSAITELNEGQSALRQAKQTVDQELATTRASLAKVKAELEDRDAEHEVLTQQHQETLTLLKSRDNDLDQLQSSNFEYREAVKQLNTLFEMRVQDEKKLRVDMHELQSKAETQATAFAALQSKYEAQLSLNRKLRDQLEQAQGNEKAKSVAGYRDLLQQAQTALKVAKAESEANEVALINKDAELNNLRGTIRELREQLVSSDRQFQSNEQLLQKQIHQLLVELDKARAGKATGVAEPLPPMVAAAVDDGAEKHALRIKTLLHKGSLAETAGKTEAATWHYQRVLELDPNVSEALIRLGNIMTEAGDFQSGERYLMRAFYNSPDNLDVLLPLGYLLTRIEKADLAISMLSRAVALFPDNPDCHRFLGVACRALGWVEPAEIQFKRAFELDDSNVDTAFNLAILYATLDPPALDKAKEWYTTAKGLGAASDPGLEQLLFQPSPNSKN